MSVRVKVYLAWWFRWLYMPGMCTMTLLGFAPDQQKIVQAMQRALTIKIELIPGIEA